MPDRPTDEQLRPLGRISDEQLRVWSDPQCNGPWTVAMAKELLELRLVFSALRASVKCLGSVTICKKCGGTGTLPGGSAEYPAGACCRIGHATDCPCNLCAWILSGYRKDKELRELTSELAERRKDSERLEWMGKDRIFDGIGGLDIDELTIVSMRLKGLDLDSEQAWLDEWLVQMRFAIDAAMKGE